jgi:hypothetical protein
MVLTDITVARTDNWIGTHRHHDRALGRSIRRESLKDPSPLFQLDHVIESPKVTSSDAIARVEEITMMNYPVSSVVISQAIRDALELPSISPTAVRRIRRSLDFS